MLAKPEPTRYIILGVLLIALDDRAPIGAARREARGDHLDGREAPRPAGRLDVVRRPQGDRRPRPPRRRGRDRQRDRPERRRQDDAVQPRHRRVRADRRRHRLRRLEHQGPRAAPDHAPRDRAHVPDAAPVPQHDRARERDGGRVRAHEGRRLPLDAAHARHAPRGAGDPRARREAARVLRRAADGLPLGPARLQPLLRQPPPARDRPRDGDEPEDAAARRARRRDEPEGDPGDHRADRQAPHRGRLHDPRDRARHARRRGNLRSRDRARPRRQDRRGHVRAGRDLAAGRRGVPRHGRDGHASELRARRRRSSSSRASTPTTGRSTSSRTRTSSSARASSCACSAATRRGSRRR